MIEIEACNRHRGIGSNDFVRRYVLRTQLQFALLAITRVIQTIDREAQIRQDFVIDNIIKKNSVRIERFLGQNDAIIKGFVVANGFVSGNAA